MKFLNYEGLGYLIEELKIKFQQQEAGKELTSNDFTNILKEKLDGIETGAQVNTVDSVNGEIGNVVITSDDIDFLSSVSGATATTVRAIIAADRIPTPANTLSSTSLTPAINGNTFVINWERFVPISGRLAVIPAAKPPAILPTKLPRA